MRVLVCGGRAYRDRDRVFTELNKLCGEISDEHPLGTIPLHIIHGGCPTGADHFADDYAVVHWCGLSVYDADWEKHGRAAGPIRNQQMIDEGKPDLVVAFPGGPGTADMVKRARRAGVEVLEIK